MRAHLEDDNVSLLFNHFMSVGGLLHMLCQRREVGELQARIEALQQEVLELQQQWKQQREYCSNHHIYDTTSPLMTADMIIQAPASAADDAVIGLLDMVQQVRKMRSQIPSHRSG